MRLVLHGTGSGDPSASRGASSTSVEFDGGGVTLIDCGEATVRAMQRDGVDFLAVSHVLISHTHPDHWAGIPNLILGWASRERRDPVTFSVREAFQRPLQAILEASWMWADRLTFPVRWVDTNEVEVADEWSIRRFPTTHLDSRRQQGEERGLAFPAFGFILSDGSRKIVFTQDIGSVDDLADVITGAELLVTESTHVRPVDILNAAERADVAHVVFTHVPPEGADFPNSGRGIRWEVAEDGWSIDL